MVKKNKKISCSILIIGNEILSGRTNDQNVSFLASWLNLNLGIQIEKCKSFSIASDIDPKYYEVFNNALKKNVNVLCYDCKFTNKGIEINKKIDLFNE